MSSNIRVNRVCQHCGKVFEAKTTVTKYCGDTCGKRAYKAALRKGKIEESKEQVHAVKTKSVELIKTKEFLTVKDVAMLLNSSTRAIYKMINGGSVQASILSPRKTFIKRTELDKLFIPKQIEIKRYPEKFRRSRYYNIAEAEARSGMSGKALYDYCKRNNIAKIQQGKFSYVPKDVIDNMFLSENV